MARSLTVILFPLQSTTHCRYRVYTKFLLTYTAIYRGNCRVLPLGITALQPQSHFHLGTPYIYIYIQRDRGEEEVSKMRGQTARMYVCMYVYTYVHTDTYIHTHTYVHISVHLCTRVIFFLGILFKVKKNVMYFRVSIPLCF